MNTNYSTRNFNVWKMLLFKVSLVFIFVIICISLFNMQIINGAKYSELDKNHRFVHKYLIAPRGTIYDVKKTALVYNQEIFTLYLNKPLPKLKQEVIDSLSTVLSIKPKELEDLIKEGDVTKEPTITVKDSITKEQMISVTTNPLYLDTGVNVQKNIVRVYPYKDLTTPILGYVSRVNEKDLKDDTSLKSYDQKGRDGIELEYDDKLRGFDGEVTEEIDGNYNIVREVSRVEPKPGNDIVLSIDIVVQKKLNEFLQDGLNKSGATQGAAVIQNVNDGSILALCSVPTFDANMLVQGISQKDFDQLNNNKGYPFVNKVIGSPQPPGSVMKTITGSAALQEKVIDINTKFDAQGTFEYGGIVFQDYKRAKRGYLNIVGGLKYSSNIFFLNTMLNLGIDKFLKYEKLFGVGKLTGIDLPGEVAGQAASPEEKQSRGEGVWYNGDSLNASIGQGDTLVTPIQVVNWISSIANGGNLYKPQLAKQVNDNLGNTIQESNPLTINSNFISNDNLNIIKQGMYETVNGENGIDSTAKPTSVIIAAKTGTAEFGTEKNDKGEYAHQHAWTASFAPFANPKISMAIFLYSGGLSVSSSQVTKDFYNWYYSSYNK